MTLKKGVKVYWNWAGKNAEGIIQEIFTKTVERKIKNTIVVRHGTYENPAILIEQEDGDEVLKLASELKEKPE
jgi:uncharacterized protein involved in tolerance to divalent cations